MGIYRFFLADNRYLLAIIGINRFFLKIGIGIGLIFKVENRYRYRQGLKLENWLKSVSVRKNRPIPTFFIHSVTFCCVLSLYNSNSVHAKDVITSWHN